MFDDYTKELIRIPGVNMTEEKAQYGIVRKFTGTNSKSLSVIFAHLMRGGDFLMLEIDGVDCGYWNTAEKENLDLYIETAIASLEGNVQFNLSPIFRRKEGCFLVQDGTWVCVPVKSIFTNVSIRKNLKHPISNLSSGVIG